MTHSRPLALIAALLLLALLPVQALAHAQLQSADPADGAVVDTMPKAVVLTFTEEISPLVLRWIAPDGSAADAVGEASGKTLTVQPPAGVEQGTYLLSWRVVSGDGHPVGGVQGFHLGAASAQAVGAGAGAGTGAALATAASRFLLSLSLVLAVGVAIHAALIARTRPAPEMRRAGLTAALAALPLSALFLACHGLDLTGLPVTGLLTAQPWQAAAVSPPARTAGLSALAAIAAFTALRSPAYVGLALLAWLLAALSYAASGHAVTAPPRWLSGAAVLLHAAAMIFWTGALLPLLLSLRRTDAVLLLRRFSAMAIGMVAALILSGAALVWLQAGDAAALIASDYGKVLGAKLLLVAGLLMLAALNRLWLTPVLAAGRTGARGALARSIMAEMVLAALILGLAASFRLTPPPRALTAMAAPAHLHIHSGKAMADVTVTPARSGPVTISVAIQDGDFGTLTPRAVEIALTPADGLLQPIRKTASPGDDGLWHVEAVTLPVAGEWNLALRVLITDFESALLEGTVTIGK